MQSAVSGFTPRAATFPITADRNARKSTFFHEIILFSPFSMRGGSRFFPFRGWRSNHLPVKVGSQALMNTDRPVSTYIARMSQSQHSLSAVPLIQFRSGEVWFAHKTLGRDVVLLCELFFRTKTKRNFKNESRFPSADI
jgi:hypothetical protein